MNWPWSIKGSVYDNPEQCSTLLILQQDKLWWLHVSGGKIVDHHVCDSGSQLTKKDVQSGLPSWLQPSVLEGPVVIDLVLDTAIDEVDRAGVIPSGSKIIDIYRRAKTIQRLRRDFPHAHVYPLRSSMDQQAAAIMHLVVPESWSAWLSHLQECNVIIQRVATGTQLVAHWSRRMSGQVLAVMQLGDRTRHLLLNNGHAVFLRTVPSQPSALPIRDEGGNESLGVEISLAQSIEYIRSHASLATTTFRIVELAGQTDKAAALGSCETPDERNSCRSLNACSPVLNVSIQNLFCLFHDLPLDFYERGHCLQDAEQQSDQQLVISSTEQGLAKQRGVVAFLFGWWRLVCVWGGSLKRMSTPRKWLVRPDTLRWAMFLERSVQYMKVKKRHQQVLQLSILLGSLAVLSICLAGVSAFVTSNEMKRHELSSLSATSTTDQSLQEHTGLNVRPEFAAGSLFVWDAFAQSSQPSPEYLLDTIASILTLMPSIHIDRLLWVMLTDDESFEALSHGLPATAPRSGIDVHGVAMPVQVQLEGFVSKSTLIDQKRQLDIFVENLQALPAISEVHALESPLDSALSSEASAPDSGQYRVSFLLGGAP